MVPFYFLLYYGQISFSNQTKTKSYTTSGVTAGSSGASVSSVVSGSSGSNSIVWSTEPKSLLENALRLGSLDTTAAVNELIAAISSDCLQDMIYMYTL